MNELTKIIGGKKYSVFGVNTDLINWARSSPLIAQSFGEAKVSEDDLFRSFDSTSDVERVEFSKQVIKKLWYSQPVLGPYPFLDTLSMFEFDRFFYPNYRDHVCHQLKVYLLGLFVYENCSKIRDEIDISFDAIEKVPEKEFLLRWLAAAVYHDIGYVLENEKADSLDGEAWQKTRDEINRVLDAPLSTMPMFGSFMTRDVEQRLIQEHDIFTPKIMYPKDIENDHKIDILDQFNQEGFRAGLAAKGSPLRAYYEYAQNHVPPKRSKGFRDHGIVSALLLLRVWRAFSNYVSTLSSKAGDNALISEQNYKKIDSLARNLALHSESIRSVAAAITLHNVNGKIWDAGDALSHGLTFHNFRICLSEPERQTPLAFLLGLVDTLQDWDRPRFRSPTDIDKQMLTDQDMSITSSNGKLLIYFSDDAMNYKNPALVKDSRFMKMKMVMKEYLQNDVIDDLIEWTDTPQDITPISKTTKSSTIENPDIPKAMAILDNLPQAFQSYGKTNLFEAGRALIVDAQKRVILVAKTPIPVVGPRPYDSDSSASPYYEREQFDAYIHVIEKAATGILKFICIGSTSALTEDIENLGENCSIFCTRIENNLRKFMDAQDQIGSQCEMKWTNEHLFTTFLVVDEKFMIWWKDEKGESVFLQAHSSLLSDALTYQAQTSLLKKNSLTNEEILLLIKKLADSSHES